MAMSIVVSSSYTCKFCQVCTSWVLTYAMPAESQTQPNKNILYQYPLKQNGMYVQNLF